jgi:hypothetical protein
LKSFSDLKKINKQQIKGDKRMTDNKVMLEPIYEIDGDLEFIVNPEDYNTIQQQIEKGKLRLAFHFQTVDCACIYAVTNASWFIDISIYSHLRKNPYTRRMLLILLKLGHFDIGVTRIGNYHVITDIKPYDSDENSEIRLHYNYPNSYAGNVAWRSINWDLFKHLVEEMNQEERDNNISATEERRRFLQISEAIQ